MKLGVKTHWRDVDAMATLARRHGATVLEYQMLPGDLEDNRARALAAFEPYLASFELRVHQPEGYLHGERVRFLDASSPDDEERARSARVLGLVADHALEMGAQALLVHPGGIWREGLLGGTPELLREGLADLPRSVPVLLENMPWFYDLRNLEGVPSGVSPAAFRIPSGLARVGDRVDGFVLDVSHAYLASQKGSVEVVRAFVRELGPHIRHVHANGSRGGVGGAGEGTPFSDSDYGADLLREVVAGVDQDAVFVPEIMDGHLEGGRRFDEGLAFLRSL